MYSFLLTIIKCNEDFENQDKPEKIYYLCIHNCALCVRLWENGLYNGKKCAQTCLEHQNNPKIVDPDCKNLTFFNSNVFRKNVHQFTSLNIFSL